MSGNTKRRAKAKPDVRKRKPARERVLEAAYDVFVTNGFSGATTDMIQSASATSKATMYAHFKSKENLFLEMMEHRLAESMTGLKELSKSTDDIGDFLAAVGFELLTSILDEPSIDLCRLVIAESIRFPHLGTIFYIVGPKVITDIVEMRLSEAHRRKELEVPDPATAAEQFLGIIKGDFLLRGLLGTQKPPDEQIRRYVDQTVATFLAAYAPKAAGTAAND